ncbi:MAG: type II secretion system GspH family protein [Synergistaceae bacterium]|jgi:hypothetical protein|nr:type II secretion system GspH family protein [Synergistaceae bacterium]
MTRTDRSDKMRPGMKALRAFTLAEILAGMLVVGIIGAAVTGSMWALFAMFSQTTDYASTNQELESIFQVIGAQVTNAGLGMPNNRVGKGSFAASFFSPGDPPIMAFMGADGADWGGPVTLAANTGLNDLDSVSGPFLRTRNVTLPGGLTVYGGPVMYYAWSVPAGVRIRGVDVAGGGEIEKGTAVILSFASGDMDALESFYYNGRNIGISTLNSPATTVPDASTRRWITFPTVRVPFWLRGWNNNGRPEAGGSSGSDTAHTVMAPESPVNFTRVLSNYEEVHLVQVCRVYLDGENLVQEFFDTGYALSGNRVRNVLASGVVGLYFTFDPSRRLVTMYVAARGADGNPVGRLASSPRDWPSFAPPIASVDRRYRLLTGTMTWRIRN